MIWSSPTYHGSVSGSFKNADRVPVAVEPGDGCQPVATVRRVSGAAVSVT